jgi:hypothetical protein
MPFKNIFITRRPNGYIKDLMGRKQKNGYLREVFILRYVEQILRRKW